jgi:oligoendopeptidase F
MTDWTQAFPASAEALSRWTWADIEPRYAELDKQPLDANTSQEAAAGWLAGWSQVRAHVIEMEARLYVATTVNTADEAAAANFQRFLDEVFPASEAADQKLKEKLLASGIEPAGFEVPLANMRAQAALYREANVPLLAKVQKLNNEYDRIIGAQTVTWDGQEVTLPQLEAVYEEPDRARREQAWRLIHQRRLDDRPAINALWGEYMQVRRQIAANADLGDDYRAYRWRELLRFDYTPEDCASFHDAIEQVVVPAAERAYERRKRRMGVERLRPWDLLVDARARPALSPFAEVDQLIAGCTRIFDHVDPALGGHFQRMQRDGLLDLDNRKNKAPGGYCHEFPAARQPFIFMNAVGIHDDVQTMLHEAGHAFHVYETAELPYVHQLHVGSEFAEVASMAMELLAAPYLAAEHGGFYTPAEAARARASHLEHLLRFWPYMAVVDAFQHWVYTHPQQAVDPAACDAQWDALWGRFMRGVDWSGLDEIRATGWHRKLHIHQLPFYYVEYGLAQLGAVQVWHNAQDDQAGAVGRYRAALSLGGTRRLPELYAAAGARFAFDASTLQRAVNLIEATLAEIDPD